MSACLVGSEMCIRDSNHAINTHPDAVGALRDTCVYSILNTEWPSVKAHLDYQLSRTRKA